MLLAPPVAARAQALARSGTTARGMISLSVSEGRLLRLDHDAANVLVGDSSIADVQVVSPRAIYVYGRKAGQTTLSAVDSDSGLAAQLTLRVNRSASMAQAALPGGGHSGAGDVSLGFEGARMVVRGAVDDLGQALDADTTARAYGMGALPPLDRTRLAGAQQVTLRVRIAEVSRTDLNELGINLNVLANPGTFSFNLMTGGFVSNIAQQAGIGGAVSGLNSAGGSGMLGGGVTQRRLNVDALVNALQSQGMLSLLAEPNLTAMSGETASFLAGGEVPIPVPQALGVTTIQYKQYGVQLAFTPTLLPGNRVALRVRPQVSELSSANATTIAGTPVPAFISRQANTSVEMASGQTLAIAGLFQRNEQNNVSRFPVLGDLPVLGALFRSTRYQRDETELVILITPYLTQPVSTPDAIALPTDDASLAKVPAPPGAQTGFVVR